MYPAALYRTKKKLMTTHTFSSNQNSQTHHHCGLSSMVLSSHSFDVPFWFEGGGYINYAFYWLTDEKLAFLGTLCYFPLSLDNVTRKCNPVGC